MYSSGLPSFARRHQANIADAIFSAGKDATTFYLPKDVSVGMHAFCAIRKKFLQACMPFAPSEKSSCRHACLLRHPKKVPAGMHAFCAIRKKSPQTCETFSPSEKSLRRRICLLNLKHPRKVSAAITTFSATGKFFVQRRLQDVMSDWCAYSLSFSMKKGP